MSSPRDLKYSKEHQWLALEGSEAQVGLTEFAVGQLGDIVFVDLPAVGTAFRAGDVLGTVESTKTSSDIFYPVSGRVIGVNEALADAPELINQDPCGQGWLVRIECSDLSEVGALLDADAYRAVTG